MSRKTIKIFSPSSPTPKTLDSFWTALVSDDELIERILGEGGTLRKSKQFSTILKWENDNGVVVHLKFSSALALDIFLSYYQSCVSRSPA